MAVNAAGIAGVAGEDPDRDGAAGRARRAARTRSAVFLSAVPEKSTPAASGQRAPSSQELDRSNSAIFRPVGFRGQAAAGQPGLDRVLPGAPASRSRRRCHRWTRRRRRGRRRGSHRPESGAPWISLEPGRTTREMISARARSRRGPAGPSRAGSPKLGGHGHARRRRGRAAATRRRRHRAGGGGPAAGL